MRELKEVVMAERHIALSKEDLLKQFEEFKMGLRRLGKEGLRISQRVEHEIERGARVVRLVFDIERLQKEMERASHKIGVEVCRMALQGKLTDPHLKEMVKEVDAIGEEIERKRRQVGRSKKEKTGE